MKNYKEGYPGFGRPGDKLLAGLKRAGFHELPDNAAMENALQKIKQSLSHHPYGEYERQITEIGHKHFWDIAVNEENFALNLFYPKNIEKVIQAAQPLGI